MPARENTSNVQSVVVKPANEVVRLNLETRRQALEVVIRRDQEASIGQWEVARPIDQNYVKAVRREWSVTSQ